MHVDLEILNFELLLKLMIFFFIFKTNLKLGNFGNYEKFSSVNEYISRISKVSLYFNNRTEIFVNPLIYKSIKNQPQKIFILI